MGGQGEEGWIIQQYDKSTQLLREKINWSWTRQGKIPTLSVLFNTVLEVQPEQLGKKIGIQIGKEVVQLSLFPNYMILYVGKL